MGRYGRSPLCKSIAFGAARQSDYRRRRTDFGGGPNDGMILLGANAESSLNPNDITTSGYA